LAGVLPIETTLRLSPPSGAAPRTGDAPGKPESI
jgi:hypothetical protein